MIDVIEKYCLINWLIESALIESELNHSFLFWFLIMQSIVWMNSTQHLWAGRTVWRRRRPWWRRGCWFRRNCRWCWPRATRHRRPAPTARRPATCRCRRRRRHRKTPTINWQTATFNRNHSNHANSNNNSNSNSSSSNNWLEFGPVFQWRRVGAGRPFRAPCDWGSCPPTPPFTTMRSVW